VAGFLANFAREYAKGKAIIVLLVLLKCGYINIYEKRYLHKKNRLSK